MPDPLRFPGYDSTLRDALLTETELFFESQVRDDRSILDLLRADYTFLNARLAAHYGVPDVYGSHFPPHARSRSGPGRAAGARERADGDLVRGPDVVVLRGKWVLETLLGSPPRRRPRTYRRCRRTTGGASRRRCGERMEQHREEPRCARPATPRWIARLRAGELRRHRTVARGGRRRPHRLLDHVAGHGCRQPRGFRRGVAAAGRGRAGADDCREAADLRARARRQLPGRTHRAPTRAGYGARRLRWSSLLLGIVRSGPFQQRIVRTRSRKNAWPPTSAQH